ncbi:hypothetical protein ACI6PO_15670 [Agrobacterium tumefaciens]
MEALFFLKQRTAFIRRYYGVASAPFRETICKIDAEEPPFEPAYSEDGEPAFLEEWIDANTSLEVLGATCVSMLSDALKLYFITWEKELGLTCQKQFPEQFSAKKGNGFVAGYKACLGHLLKTDWADCPADFAVIEQIVLARNSAQRAKEITDLQITHDSSVRGKHPKPFFLNDYEKRLIETDQFPEHPWFNPKLVVTQENLFEALRQVDLLCEYMEEPLFDVMYGRR